jgi:hypothetical protein
MPLSIQMKESKIWPEYSPPKAIQPQPRNAFDLEQAGTQLTLKILHYNKDHSQRLINL